MVSIKIAFILTINRTQSQSASKCNLLLPKNEWTHGQIYVAFSRYGNPNNLFVLAEQEHFEYFDLQKVKYLSTMLYIKKLCTGKN